MVRPANHQQPMAISARLTQIAMAIRPEGMIGEQVLPEVNVGAKKFEYTRFNVGEQFTIPDTRIGRSSQANRVEFGSENQTESTEAHGLEDVVPISDIDAARDAGAPDPLDMATDTTSRLVSLAREKRVADIIGDLDTYPAANRVTLAGDSQWDNTASNPVKTINEALDKTLMRPNMIVMGPKVWTKFRQHPKVVEAIRGTGAGDQSQGLVMRTQVAELFEVRNLLIGQPWYNSAPEGQDEVYARLWGPHCSLLYIDANINAAGGKMPTFGFTGGWKMRRTGTYDEPGTGSEGAIVVKTVEDVKELIVFPELGYHFHDAVA